MIAASDMLDSAELLGSCTARSFSEQCMISHAGIRMCSAMAGGIIITSDPVCNAHVPAVNTGQAHHQDLSLFTECTYMVSLGHQHHHT